MSRIPDNLDPATLRWVADDQTAQAEWELNGIDTLKSDGEFVFPESTRRLYRDRARHHRNEAKRLRALATRIERRRTGGRHAR